MVWISSNTIFLTTTWFLRFHKGKLDLWGCFMLICWPKQRATVILLQLMTFLLLPCWNMTKIFEFYMLDWSQCVMASKRGRRRKQSDFDWIVLILIFSPFHLFFSSHVLFTGIFSILIRALGSNLRGECTKLCELN